MDIITVGITWFCFVVGGITLVGSIGYWALNFWWWRRRDSTYHLWALVLYCRARGRKFKDDYERLRESFRWKVRRELKEEMREEMEEMREEVLDVDDETTYGGEKHKSPP